MRRTCTQSGVTVKAAQSVNRILVSDQTNSWSSTVHARNKRPLIGTRVVDFGRTQHFLSVETPSNVHLEKESNEFDFFRSHTRFIGLLPTSGMQLTLLFSDAALASDLCLFIEATISHWFRSGSYFSAELIRILPL